MANCSVLLIVAFVVGGQAAKVYWASNGYHRGGYAYRLCRVYNGEYWKVTEECFQKGHLKFSGREQKFEANTLKYHSKSIHL